MIQLIWYILKFIVYYFSNLNTIRNDKGELIVLK